MSGHVCWQVRGISLSEQRRGRAAPARERRGSLRDLPSTLGGRAIRDLLHYCPPILRMRNLFPARRFPPMPTPRHPLAAGLDPSCPSRPTSAKAFRFPLRPYVDHAQRRQRGKWQHRDRHRGYSLSWCVRHLVHSASPSLAACDEVACGSALGCRLLFGCFRLPASIGELGDRVMPAINVA